jgi:REP element-mobilizing transposase RayT
MPNHLHAILILNKTNNERSYDSYDSHVETHGRASLQINQSNQSNEQTQKQQFDRKPKSISSFVAGFKSAINSKIDNFIDEHNLDILKYNRNNHFFQPNYHDHIIRNDSEYQRIKEYIVNNPSKWNDDKFNPTNKITK